MKPIRQQSDCKSSRLEATRSNGWGRGLLLYSLLTLIVSTGCSTSSKRVGGLGFADVPDGATEPSYPIIEPWAFAGVAGQTMRTANYRIHTTSTNEELVQDLPAFYEAANGIYEQFGGAETKVPGTMATNRATKTREVMDVYLFGTRREWELFSEDLLGDRARRYVQIGRGGFSTRGSAIIYDLGYADSLKIAAHEGWHQFVQRNFKESIPVWLDEGIAAQMEGITLNRQNGQAALEVHANGDRLGQLQRALAAERLPDLATLLSTQPNNLLGDSEDLILDYYAEVWALSCFLNEFDKGRYAERLHLLLRDARHGQLKARVEATLLKNGWQERGEFAGRTSPVSIFQVYFAADLSVAHAEFMEFKQELAHSPAAPSHATR